MPQPGTTPITAPIDTTALGDTYPTHKASRGIDDSPVATFADLALISSLRLSEGMVRYVIADGIDYRLENDLTTWTAITTGAPPADVMLKSIYDTNDDGIVNNSALLNSQNAAFYLARANHTGVQAISTVTGLQTALDAKEDEINKGAANGYVPLNAGVTIDPIYLPVSSPINPVEAWDVVTNTPTLADGGVFGTMDAFIVTVSANPTARDLGSGSENWSDGDLAIYTAGNIFIRVPRAGVGVSQVTTDNGVLTGAVTLDDTSYIAPSTDRNYLTDDQLASFPAGADATDQLVLQSDLANAIVVGNSFFTPELYADGQTLGAGTSVTLTSLGYTNGSAAAIWTRVDSDYTIDVNTMSIDWITNQEMWLTAKYAGVSTCYLTPGRCYVPNQSIDLPGNMANWTGSGNRRANRYAWDLAGSCIRNLSATNFPILNRYPANQAEADTWVTVSFDIRNGAIFGRNTSNAADIGIKIGAHSNSTWMNLHIESCGMNVLNEFCLTSSFHNIDVQGFGTHGFASRSGTWSGAGSSNAQCNANKFYNFKGYNNSGKTPTAAWYQLGGYGSQLIGSVFEGASGSAHHVYYEMTADQVAQLLIMDGFQFETAGVTRAGIKIKGYKGSAVFRNWQNIIPAADMAVLFECETVAGQLGAPTMYIQNGPDTWDPAANEGLLRSVNNNSTLPGNTSQPWEPRWDVHTTQLPNNTTLNVAANFDTGVANAFVPQSAHCRFTPLLG